MRERTHTNLHSLIFNSQLNSLTSRSKIATDTVYLSQDTMGLVTAKRTRTGNKQSKIGY